MTIPTWEDFAIFLKTEKKMAIPNTFYGKYEYIRDYFLSRPFEEQNVKKMFADIRQDLYYRQDTRMFTRTLNEYIQIVKLISEYEGYIKQHPPQEESLSTGITGINLTLDEFIRFLQYDRKVKIHPCYRARFRYIKEFFKDKEFNKTNVTLMLQDLREGSSLKNGQPLSEASLNKYTHFDVSHLRNAMELSHPLLRSEQTLHTLALDFRKYTERFVNTKRFQLSIEESASQLDLRIVQVNQ